MAEENRAEEREAVKHRDPGAGGGKELRDQGDEGAAQQRPRQGEA